LKIIQEPVFNTGLLFIIIGFGYLVKGLLKKFCGAADGGCCGYGGW